VTGRTSCRGTYQYGARNSFAARGLLGAFRCSLELEVTLVRPYDPQGFDHLSDYGSWRDVPLGEAGILRRWRVFKRYTSGAIDFDQPERRRIRFSLNRQVVLDAATPRGTVTLSEYLKALETGSLVDIVVRRESDERVEGTAYWCHVEYRNQHLREEYAETRSTSFKPDALFAWRLAYSTKTERHAARWLQELGHDLQGAALEVTDSIPVTIDFVRGRDRAQVPDLYCTRCHARFEVKGRMSDRHRRFSHSQARPFWDENPVGGYNLLVFPNGNVEAYSNAELIPVIRTLPIQQREAYDTFVQLPRKDAKRLALRSEQLRCAPKGS
jgi:hypothetical protein